MSHDMDLDKPCCLYNYIVTAHKPSAVFFVATGHITDANDINLVVAKSTRIEIYTFVSEEQSLQLKIDVPLYGRIANIALIKCEKTSKDLVFVVTEKYKTILLEYDCQSGRLVTRSAQDVRDKNVQALQGLMCAGYMASLDPRQLAIGLHLYTGHLKVLFLNEQDGFFEGSVNKRLDETDIIDLVFLDGYSKLTFAVLFKTREGGVQCKTYEVGSRSDAKLVPGTWEQKGLDRTALYLVAVPQPYGGVLVVGERSVAYASGAGVVSLHYNSTLLYQAYARIDACRYLLGGDEGYLHLLECELESGAIKKLKMRCIGQSSPASSIAIFPHPPGSSSITAFIGSRHQDSQLVQLDLSSTQPAQTGVTLLESKPCLGPILDIAVMDMDRHGQNQFVTANGGRGMSTFRLLRSGISVLERASVKQPGIRGLWSLKRKESDMHDTYLVLSFAHATHVMWFKDEEHMEEFTQMSGLDGGMPTLWAGNCGPSNLVQVTGKEVRLFDGDSLEVMEAWRPERAEDLITLASGNSQQVLVATSSRNVHLLETATNHIMLVATYTLPADISCVHLPPTSFGEASGLQFLVAAGTWNRQVLLLHPHAGALQVALQVDVEGEVIPRAVMLHEFEDTATLLLGMADGTLLSWNVGTDAGTGRISTQGDGQRMVVGTRPLSFRAFKRGAENYVFVACDRPSVIHNKRRKLLVSNVNEAQINHMCPFNTAALPDSLALATEDALRIGSVDGALKLQSKAVSVERMLARRVVHQPSTHTLAIAQHEHMSSSGPVSSSMLKVLDEVTFAELAEVAFTPSEMATSLLSGNLGEDASTSYYVVGNAIVIPQEAHVQRGFIRVFSYDNSALTQVASLEVEGSVWQLALLQGKLLACVNKEVRLYSLVTSNDGKFCLKLESKYECPVNALYMAVRGDFILVGDMMRGPRVLRYDASQQKLEERARDTDTSWCLALEMLDEDTYLVADEEYNLCIMRKKETGDEEARKLLEMVSEFHLGERVNVFRHASLVMRLNELSRLPSLVFGTQEGSLGLIVSLPKGLFDRLTKLQIAMREIVPSVGDLSHVEWRAYEAQFNLRKAPENSFVDGDLIEIFPDLGREEMEAVVKAAGGEESVQSVLELVDELIRLHGA